MRKRALALFAVCFLSFGLVACGDDNSAPTSSNTTTQTTNQTPSTGTTGTTTEATPSNKDADSSRSTKSDYIDEVNKVQTTFATEAGKLNLATPNSPEDFKKSLDKLVPLLDTLSTDLTKITPPGEVTKEHAELLKGINDYRDTLSDNKSDLVAKKQATVQSAASKIGSASTSFSQDFDKLIKSINDKLGVKDPSAASSQQ